MSDSSRPSSGSCRRRLDRDSSLRKIWGSCRSSENWNMIADAFLGLRTTSRLFKSRDYLVGQGYQGNVFISQASVREKTVNESSSGSSSSLGNLYISSKLLFLPVFVRATTVSCAGYPASVGRVTLCHVASRRQLRRLFGSSRTTEGFSWGNSICAKRIASLRLFTSKTETGWTYYNYATNIRWRDREKL